VCHQTDLRSQVNKGIARVSKFLQPNYESDRTHVSPIPKGHNLPHSGLTNAYDRTNHSPFAPAYPRTHDYGSVQSNAPTREPLHTLSSFAVASPLAKENINLPCARRNPSDSLNLALARNGEKLRGDRQQQQFVYLKSTLMRSQYHRINASLPCACASCCNSKRLW